MPTEEKKSRGLLVHTRVSVIANKTPTYTTHI